MSNAVLLNVEEGIAVITINRADKRNAIDEGTAELLEECWRRATADESVSVLIITGAGDKAFVAGSDVAALARRDPWVCLDNPYHFLLNKISESPIPVIAAINGWALGGGCELAMACDIRIASETARLGQPEVGLGILPGAGGTQRLPRIVGLGAAMKLILTGEIIDAKEAYRIGLVDEVVSEGQALDRAKQLAHTIAQKGPLAVRMAKLALLAGQDTSLPGGLLVERLSQALVFTSEDRLEGLTAFLEKRPPKFRRK